MTEKIRCALYSIMYSIMGIALGIVLLLPGGHVQASEKKTIYNSSYVSFSPDGKAWTTCAGDRNYNGMTKTKQRQCIPESNLPWRHYRRENIITDPAGEVKYP